MMAPATSTTQADSTPSRPGVELTSSTSGPRVERHLLVKSARMQGFVVLNHFDLWDSAIETLTAWVREGKLHYAEDVTDGLESCLDALAGLYRGENLGKRIIRL